MIRVGILGAAQIAPDAMIAPAAKRDDCVVTAVGCRDKARGAAFASRHGIPAVETDYEALVQRDDVDLVYNALPPSRHADLSIAALRAGKAVLCEKPFAMNSDEAAEMIRVAKDTGGLLIEAFHYRFHPVIDRVLSELSSGRIGAITDISATFLAPVPFRPGEVRHTLGIGGGSLMDMGCYPIHWARTVMGQEPEVTAASCLESQPGVDLETTATLAFENGVTAQVTCGMDDRKPFTATLIVKGSEGQIVVDNPLTPHAGHQITITTGDRVEKVHCDLDRTTYDYQLEAVIAAMHGGPVPPVGGVDAVANMRVIDAIYRKAGLQPRGTYANPSAL